MEEPSSPPPVLYKESDPVTILDDSCFAGQNWHIRARYCQGPGVLKVYASWCPHCQSKVQCINKLAELLRKHNVVVYVIEATHETNPIFLTVHKIHSYPTFLSVSKDGTIGPPLLSNGEPAYTVPDILRALCAENGDVCQYQSVIDQCGTD